MVILRNVSKRFLNNSVNKRRGSYLSMRFTPSLVLVLPQAIAFAALAGLPPAMGLAAAVLPCAVAALAGSSRQVVSGPTNATSLALGAMLVPLAAGDASLVVPLALTLTLFVGLMQLALALARLGSLANFISPSVMHHPGRRWRRGSRSARWRWAG